MAFKKGQSGNPRGRPKVPLSLINLAKIHTVEAVGTLVKAMRGAENEGTRVAAAEALLSRGWGKPAQTVDMTVTDERMVVNAPTPEETADDWAGKHRPH